MTFENWLMNHTERIHKDINISAEFLIDYINMSDSRPLVDVILWKLSALYDIAEYTDKEKMEYLHSYIDMYRRDYAKQSGSRSKGSVVSQLIGQGIPYVKCRKSI